MPTAPQCPVCDGRATTLFFEATDMPAHVGLQWPDRAAARACPKGDIALHFCDDCGHVFNAAFDPRLMEYTQAYDNSLHYSPRFQQYTHEVATRLIERYGLRDKDVVEIGCGKGDFLMLLSELGGNRGTGFDPSYEERDWNGADAGRLTFVQDFYSEAYADHAADLVCSRYVFEHIPAPMDFLRTVRRAVGDRPDTVVYFEVPNVDFILRDLSVWDVIYEHCGYFGAASLARAFERAGFDVKDVVEGYDGQFIGVEAAPALHSNGRRNGVDLSEMRRRVQAYEENHRARMQTWAADLAAARDAGRRLVVWGGGAKAVSFLNLLKLDEQVPYVVDINPNKQGRYMPGTGQEIVAPEALTAIRPDVVVVMNPIYRDEIRTTTEALGLDVSFLYAS